LLEIAPVEARPQEPPCRAPAKIPMLADRLIAIVYHLMLPIIE